MANVYSIADLEYWDERITALVQEIGLNCYPQEFEICDHHEMLSYMAYSGLPSHYSHWSYGKRYEQTKTLYDYGVEGLPYEMVINTNPALAYLMKNNSLLLQILTIAHVYGHNDFFRNNFTFQSTNPEHMLSAFKMRAARIRGYMEDPSIGIEQLEPIIDAAHALQFQCRRNFAIKKLSHEEQRQAILDISNPEADPFQRIHKRREYIAPDLQQTPLEPEEDILLFIRDNNPYLLDWERDVLTIVHEEARYFVPQIETKIMNEGWASYWHKQILEGLNLPYDLQMEFMVRHNQVIRPHPGGLNPYHIGFKIWEDIRRRYDETPASERSEKLSSPSRTGKEMIFAVRETDRDASFLRRHLTDELIRELDLFQYAPKNGEFVISEIADDEEACDRIRQTLIKNVGTNSIPIIKIHDADYDGNRSLYLIHEHDGRDLEAEHAQRTLEHLHALWHHEVVLETIRGGKRILLIKNEEEFSIEEKKY